MSLAITPATTASSARSPESGLKNKVRCVTSNGIALIVLRDGKADKTAMVNNLTDAENRRNIFFFDSDSNKNDFDVCCTSPIAQFILTTAKLKDFHAARLIADYVSFPEVEKQIEREKSASASKQS